MGLFLNWAADPSRSPCEDRSIGSASRRHCQRRNSSTRRCARSRSSCWAWCWPASSWGAAGDDGGHRCGAAAHHAYRRTEEGLRRGRLGTAGVLRRSVHHRRGRRARGPDRRAAAADRTVGPHQIPHLRPAHRRALERGQQRARRDAAAHARGHVSRSACGLADAGHGLDAGRQPDDHRLGRQHHRRRARGRRRCPRRVSRLLPNRPAGHRGHTRVRFRVAVDLRCEFIVPPARRPNRGRPSWESPRFLSKPG